MNNKKNKKITIAVGMSGGVDSTMAAYFLKKQGYNVVGLTMKIWDNSLNFKPRKSGCFGPNEEKEIKEAKKAAKKIGIKHFVIDLKKEYREYVLDYFKKEYLKGRTPNPCVMCNAKIKFDCLLRLALASGIKFDKFATGHYARVGFDNKQNRYFLKKGIDKTKDQSYFLYRLNQNQLRKIVFPLGEYKKAEIKKIAKKLGYGYYSQKPESQNFIECRDYGIIFNRKFKKGNIIDRKGKIIGRHSGIVFYTIGQRKKLNIGGLKEPMYVLKINGKKNEITVALKKFLFSNKISIKNLCWNFLVVKPRLTEINCQVKIRYGSKPVDCNVILINKKTAEVEFKKPQFAPAPGQSAVFYKGDEVLGGGIIF